MATTLSFFNFIRHNKTTYADAQYTLSISAIRNRAQQIKKHDAYTPAIGEDLGIVGEELTVDKHRKSLLKKTGCANTAELIAWAAENDLLD